MLLAMAKALAQLEVEGQLPSPVAAEALVEEVAAAVKEPYS